MACFYSNFKWVSDDVLLLVGVYVDDFCIISDSQDEVDKLKAYLAPHGAVEVDSNKWLGLNINFSRHSINFQRNQYYGSSK